MAWNRLREPLLLLFLLLSWCLLWALHQAEVSQAQSSGIPFSAEPAPGTASYKTGYFVINASPGETVTETLLLRNDSDAPIKLRVMSVDATTGPYGGVSYGLPNEPVKKIGTWTTLPVNEIDLAPRETKTIPLSIKVPADAASGHHIGGVAVWLPIETDQADPAQSAITTQVRRVLSVHVVVPGSAGPLLVIEGVRPVVRPDGVYLEIDISSEGRLLTKGDGFIELPEDDFLRDFSLDTFVPDTSIAYPIKWINDPEEGTYQTHVVINHDDHVAEFSGSFTIGPELTAQEEAREGRKSHTLLYGILLAIAIITAGLFYYFKRRQRQAKSPG